MKRWQARRSNGRFTRNTTENTFGLHVDFCSNCRRGNTWNVGESKPEKCHNCSEPFVGAFEQAKEKPEDSLCQCGHEIEPWHHRGGGCMVIDCACKEARR